MGSIEWRPAARAALLSLLLTAGQACIDSSDGDPTVAVPGTGVPGSPPTMGMTGDADNAVDNDAPNDSGGRVDVGPGTAAGGSAEGTDPRPDDDEPPEVRTRSFALVSDVEGPIANTNSCEGDAWFDHDCDLRLEEEIFSCNPEDGKHISHVEHDPCPVCADDEPGRDTSDCSAWSAEYRAFMLHNVTQSCANWCESDDDCFAWELRNACGTVLIPLFGGIDEEPILFAETFATHNCGGCEAVTATAIGKAADGRILGDGPSELLERYVPACDTGAKVCVLRPEGVEDPAEQDAGI